MIIRKTVFVAVGGAVIALGFVALGYYSRDLVDTQISRLTESAFSHATELLEEVRHEAATPPPLIRREEVSGARLTRDGVFSWTLSHRTAGELPAFAEHDSLDLIAEARMQDMFAGQYFDHISPSGESVSTVAQDEGYAYLRIGENIALGNFANDEDIVQAWMDSPGHRANILNDRYTELGIAVGEGMFEERKTWIGVQIFGLPRSACPKTDDILHDGIDADKARVAVLDVEAAELRALIEAAGKPKTKAEIIAYNEQVDAYNTLVQEMNVLIDVVRTSIDDYNEQVRALNVCIESGP